MPVSVPRPAVVLVGAAILDVLVRPAGPEVFRSGSMPVEEIALQEKHIRPCRGCQSCDAAPHVCPLARTDDAEAIFAAIAAADVVLWTSPVYFYGLPAQAKALVDRSQRIWAGVEAGRPAAAKRKYPAVPEKRSRKILQTLREPAV